MSEVKNVTITVPVGLNGWQQTGSVVINGMKVEFPMGVETQVPETAAALLEKLIEEAKENAAEGSVGEYKQYVTDGNGNIAWEDRLAYKTTATAKVENLAATALVSMGDEGFALKTPWAADLVAGAMCTVNYNGADYECEAIDLHVPQPDIPFDGCMLGNFDALGMTGIDGSNTDAPFVVVAFANDSADGAYGQVVPLDGATSVTLSVTSKQTRTTIKTIDPEYLPTAGGVFNVRTTATVYKTDTGHDFTAFDKTYAEMAAAHEAGSHVRLVCTMYINDAKYGDLIGEVVATQYTNLEMTEARETPIFGIRIPMGVLAAKTNVHYWLSEGKNGEIVASLMSE